MRLQQPRTAGVLLVAVAVATLGSTLAEDPSWRMVAIPAAWKQPPSDERDVDQRKHDDGFSWYRCVVRLPDSWRGRSVDIFIEPVDDARQTYFNGQLVGASGTFPPLYRSGLGETSSHRLPPDLVRFGAENSVAVRVYSSDGRTNFSVAAPAILAGDEAIRLEGNWHYRPGDDPTWATFAADPRQNEESATVEVYSTVDAVSDVSTYVRLRKGDHAAYPPSDALRRFEVADDLAVDLVLAEPHVQQPLFLNFDERGRLWVLEYLQYPNPAGMKVMSRDKALRTVYDRVSPPPPHHFRGRDRITIHEDTDGDGRFDTHRVFVDNLNIATSFVQGRGGVWVLNPPYLLFYPDRDHDDVPDDIPEVHLEGFGMEDTHSVANSLRWGPDGWLYAAQGSTVSGKVRRPGDTDVSHSMGQLIWRYHPEWRLYEIFGEGGGNSFGVEIDSKGRVFSGHNGGNSRGFHYVQGGYSAKAFGKHGMLSNPYAFGYFKAMEHHDSARFSHTFVIYEGEALPDRYHGALIGLEPLQGQVVLSDISPAGSSFTTSDISRPLVTDDQWFRPVDIKVGPDGALYIADFHEQRIDHSSHFAGRIAVSTGRIYRLREKHANVSSKFDLSTLSSTELIALFAHSNRWFRRCALRILGDRRDEGLVPQLFDLVKTSSGQVALEALWALNLCGGLKEENAMDLLDHGDAHVRLWTVRLVCDRQGVSEKLAVKLTMMAISESNVEVRSQLACSARRLDVPHSLSIVRALFSRHEDNDDVHMPLLLWWALEANVTRDPGAALTLFDSGDLWRSPIVERNILARLMRRFSAEGTRQSLTACARLLGLATDEKHVELLLQGFEEGLKGQSLTGLPKKLTEALERSGGGSLALRLRQQDADATSRALSVIGDEGSEEEIRLELLDILSEVPQPRSVPDLFNVLRTSRNKPVRLAVLSALESHSDPEIAHDLLKLLPTLPNAVRDATFRTLASRKTWGNVLLDACENERVTIEAVPVEARRKLLLHGDNHMADQVRKHWGRIAGATTTEMKARLAALEELLSVGSGNPYRGKRHFQAKCGNCHVFFGKGGSIGPDLTSGDRSDLKRMLENIVNPSAEIREGYEDYAAVTRDGRVFTGFLIDQDQRVAVLRGADGRNVVVSRAALLSLRASERSLMPEGLLSALSDQEVRDLFAYLRSTQPLP